MNNTDDNEQSKDSLARASTAPSADHVQATRFTNTFYGACLVALIWAIALLGFFIKTKPSTTETIVASITAILSTAAAIIGVFQPPKFPTIPPRVTQIIIAGILVAEFMASASWGLWSYYQTHRSIDVLSKVALHNNLEVRSDKHARLDVTITDDRDILVLVFRVIDHENGIGICEPYTVLSVTTDVAGNRGQPVRALPEQPASVELPTGIKEITLDITVTNTRGDRNCAVDLSIASAKLQKK